MPREMSFNAVIETVSPSEHYAGCDLVYNNCCVGQRLYMQDSDGRVRRYDDSVTAILAANKFAEILCQEACCGCVVHITPGTNKETV